MFKNISHVGIAVKDLDASADLFRKLLGKEPDHTERLPDHKVSVALFELGESGIELTAATDADSPIATFIEKRGEGVHHLSFLVEDSEHELARLKQLGVRLIDEKPRLGANGCLVAFLHPKSTNGVLVEISQKPH
ncbi:MAG TPA: methylmalonyl-CoA epimerase [Bacteroidetes bacterium]|nr:methylmalonyl-CoA epimerase [Bacteroidota bacterium]